MSTECCPKERRRLAGEPGAPGAAGCSSVAARSGRSGEITTFFTRRVRAGEGGGDCSAPAPADNTRSLHAGMNTRRAAP